jgi:AMMECR1 domain-containing protein
LIVSRGSRRGLLLPQVAEEYRLTSQRFLEETCVKAGLPRDAWKDPSTRIEAFTAEVFSESEMDRVPDGTRSE